MVGREEGARVLLNRQMPRLGAGSPVNENDDDPKDNDEHDDGAGKPRTVNCGVAERGLRRVETSRKTF